jgi:hypothetical protein
MDYWLVDDAGGLRKRFTVVVGSLEDELSATLFAVENQALVRLQVRELHGGQSSVDRVVEIDRLVELPAGDKAGLARMDVAVADERAREDEMTRRAQARIAAIPGAQEEHDAGDEFRAAQHILEWRITQYDDPLSASMLRALLRFGDLYANVPTVKPALDLFIVGCRQAAFDRTLPQGNVVTPGDVGVVRMSVREREEAAELAAVLRDLERELNVDADIQDQVDARGNAMAFWAAARSVAEAGCLLATMLDRAS